MKKIKYILMICFIVITLSGCTVRSDITVAPNGKTTEKVKVLNNNAIFESEKYSKKEMIESATQQYLTALNFRKYTYETVIGDDLSGLESTKTYDNICSYFQDTIFNQYVYHHMNCIENDYYYEISNDTDYIPYCSDCSDWPMLSDVEFKITLPVSAEEQNADEVNGNTYIWKYSKNTTNKNFYLKISKDALKQSEEEYNSKISKKKIMNVILIALGILGSLVIVGLIGVILYKKHQKNKLDY